MEVEPREGQPLRLQVLCQGLLADGQSLLDVLQVVVEPRLVAGLDNVGRRLSVGHYRLGGGKSPGRGTG